MRKEGDQLIDAARDMLNEPSTDSSASIRRVFRQPQDAGGQFTSKNVTFQSTTGGAAGTRFIGEVTNGSAVNYGFAANFTMSVYDSSGALLDSGMFSAFDIGPGETRSFQNFLLELDDTSAIASYKVHFTGGN